MIVFVIGTTAEAIKLQPIWKILDQRQTQFEIISLGQHTTQLEQLITEYGYFSRLVLVRDSSNSNLSTRLSALKWFVKVLLQLQYLIKKYPKHEGAIVVQGDTLSTLIGALVGKFNRFTVVHIEAGLRSFSIRNPFPEEINRRIVSRLANFHLCPSQKEIQNLTEIGIRKENIGLTQGNSSLDHLASREKIMPVINEPYGVVTLHRQELLGNQELFRSTLEVLFDAAQDIRLLFFTDSRSKVLIEKYAEKFPDNFEVRDKLKHLEFLKVIEGSTWVITDSGGLQEECAFFGVPTLIHRTATERFDGIGRNVVLSNRETSKIYDFLRNFDQLRARQTKLVDSPSKIIVSCLEQWKIL